MVRARHTATHLTDQARPGRIELLVQRSSSDLRVKVPCRDERDFHARLGDHVAAHGLRVPTDHPRPIGTKVRVALEFRDGRTFCADAVVDAHVQLDTGSGVNVRFGDLGAAEAEPAGAPPPPLPGPPAAREPAYVSLDDLEAFPTEARTSPGDALATSGEIIAMVDRRVVRFQRGALAAAAVALVVAGAGYAMARRALSGRAPEVASARVDTDRLIAEGRIFGPEGALEALLAARRLHPDDAATAARLGRIADLLETLGARALDRGDLALASVHLSGAERAAPDRASVHARLTELEKRRAALARPSAPEKKRAASPPPRRTRAAAASRM